jgi:hypothetical protein
MEHAAREMEAREREAAAAAASKAQAGSSKLQVGSSKAGPSKSMSTGGGRVVGCVLPHIFSCARR